MNFILLGPPGSGKGTQGEYLEKKLSIKRISTGDLLRNEVAAGSDLGHEIKDILSTGALVSDDIVLRLLKENIAHKEYDRGFILDGFPRNLSQANLLDEILEKMNKHIDAVFYFHISEQQLIDRICNRFYCESCKANYNKLFKPPKVAGVCDECGGTSFKTRPDDNIDSVKTRFSEYKTQTLPLISYYDDRGILHKMDSSKNIEKISKEIEEVLKKLLT